MASDLLGQVQAQVAACLLRRGSMGFDTRVKMKVVGSLVEGMTQVRQSQQLGVFCLLWPCT